jgi:hypothetical protein
MFNIKAPFAAITFSRTKGKTVKKEKKDRLFMKLLSSTNSLKEIHIVLYVYIRITDHGATTPADMQRISAGVVAPS